MSGGPLLEVEGLEVRYGAVPAVRNLSFDVGEGEIVGLIGPNGAGKTTTLLAIMGGLPVASGDLRLAGKSIRGRAPEEIARQGVALVPEGRRIYGDLTVEENLRLGLAARPGRSGAAIAPMGSSPSPDRRAGKPRPARIPPRMRARSTAC